MFIVLEDLNVSGMMKNRKLSKSIQDVSFYEFRRMLEYKLNWIRSKVLLVDRFYPSSKLCSCCGNKKESLSLSDRFYICEECGLEIDRDLNASYNLRNLFSTVSSTGIKVCGDVVSPKLSLLNFGGVSEAEIKLRSC